MPSPGPLSTRPAGRVTDSSTLRSTGDDTSGPPKQTSVKETLRGRGFEEQESLLTPGAPSGAGDGDDKRPSWMRDATPMQTKTPDLGTTQAPLSGPRMKGEGPPSIFRFATQKLGEIAAMLPPGTDREFTPVISAAELREKLRATKEGGQIWAALGGAVAGELAFSLFDYVFYQIGRNLGPDAVLVYRAVQGTGQVSLALGLLELFGFESTWAFMKLWNGFVADLGYYMWGWLQDKIGLDIPTFEGADALEGGLAGHDDVSWGSWSAFGQVKGTNGKPGGPEESRLSGREAIMQALVTSIETLVEPLLARWVPGFDLELGLSKTFKVGFRASGDLAEIDGRPLKLHLDAYNVGPGKPYYGGGLTIPFDLGGRDGQVDVQAGHDKDRGWSGRVGVKIGM